MGADPGFVQVLSDTELRWPDYACNAMLMTLGSPQQDLAAGSYSWTGSGATVQLTGAATVDWDGAGRLPGAERVVHFRLQRAVEIAHVSPLASSRPEYSQRNPPLGTEPARH